MAAKANETLSQFVAKVLDQLSLSAWLPSAALVLSLAFVVNLNASKGAFGKAVSAFRDFGLTGTFFLVASVVVLTTVTQAFEFEAIRLLEGYWGPNCIAEGLADVCCWHQRRFRDRLSRRRQGQRVEAFEKASTALRIDKFERSRDGLQPVATERDLEVISARLLRLDITTTREERESARSVPWEEYAPGRLIRRAENIGERLKEFPGGNRLLPTRLGNVLRASEDAAFPTSTAPLDGAVQRIFHTLPLTLQSEHDQHRTRLNLYCSMVVVTGVVTAVSAVRLWRLRWPYVPGTVFVGVTTLWLFYRAAIASARAYGTVLRSIGSRITE